jgi:hypothetical protein
LDIAYRGTPFVVATPPNIRVRTSSGWRDVVSMWTKVGGVWKSVDTADVKVGGIWRN